MSGYKRTPDTERRKIASADQTRSKNRQQPSMPKLPWQDEEKDSDSDRKDESDD